MKIKITMIALLIIIFTGALSIYLFTKINLNIYKKVGDVVDNYNGINIYFNGGVDQVAGRNLSADNYNIGIKYQCVEFVKRYYFEKLNHKMPDSFGHAKDFIDAMLKDGEMNVKRDLMQFSNPSSMKPEEEDIIVFSPTILNRYGHIAIISKVTENEIEIVQQNPGPFGSSRQMIPLIKIENKYRIDNERVLGTLRKMKANPQDK